MGSGQETTGRGARPGASASGGAGTQQGISFQNELSAYYFVLMLAQGDGQPPFGWPAPTRLLTAWCEALLPVDDVVLLTSSDGAAYVQAKSSRLTLSPLPQSDLASAIDQFTRRLLGGEARQADPDSQPWERPIDVERDRFVLAAKRVPDTVGRIRELCERARGSAQWSLFRAGVASGSPLEQALDIVRQHAENAVGNTGASPALDDELFLRLLQCLRIVAYDLSEDRPERRDAQAVLRSRVLADPDDADRTWTELCALAADLAEVHGSVDVPRLRGRLLSAGIALKDAPDYSADAKRLRKWTEDGLGAIPDEIDCGDAGTVRVLRKKVVEQIRQAAVTGDVLVHGEPGAGKSWALRQLVSGFDGVGNAAQPSEGQALLIRAEDLPATTEAQAHETLRLEHQLPDILRHMEVAGTNVMVFDGLDAARDENQAKTIRRLIDRVVQQTAWKVVASIRTFDFEHSRHFRDLFSQQQGRSCQHIEVQRLDDDELETAFQQAPSLGQVCAQSPALKDIVRTPFNLALLGAVVKARLADRRSLDDLNRINAPVELLEEYWEERVTGKAPGVPRAKVACEAARIMLQEGRLRAPRSRLSPVGSEVRDLLSDGVFVSPSAHGEDFVGFFHNIFADFAAAKALIERVDEVVALLRTPGRLLFRRPAVRLLLAYTWVFARAEFWYLFEAICGAEDLRAIWRILPPDVLTEQRVSLTVLGPLLNRLKSEETPPWALQSVAHLFSALSTNHSPPHPDRHQAWLQFADALVGSLAQAFTARALDYVRQWLSPGVHADQSDLALVNRFARSVFEWGRDSGDRSEHVMAMAVRTIAQTFAADPGRSREVLQQVVQTEDHRQCWWLANEIGAVIPVAPEFAGEVYVSLFRHRETSEAAVPLGSSYVLPLQSNLRQQWDSIWHLLHERYPALLSASPASGTSVLVRIAPAIVEEQWTRYNDALPPLKVADVGGASIQYREDRSAWWFDPRIMHDSRQQLVSAFETWLTEVGHQDPEAAERALCEAFAVLMQENSLAVVWNACLRAAAEAPELLAAHVFPLLATPAILGSSDSRHHAATALSPVFASLSRERRAVVEQAILSLADPAGSEEDGEWLRKTRDKLIWCLRDSPIETEEARAQLALIRSRGGAESLVPPLQFHGTEWRGEGTDDDFLETSGVDIHAKPYHWLKPYIAPVSEFEKTYRNQTPDVEGCRRALEHLRALERALESREAEGVDARQKEHARTLLAQSAEYISRVDEWKLGDRVFQWAVERIIRATEDPAPVPDGETEAGFEKFPSWSPSPRVDAAQGLMNLARRKESFTPEIRTRIEQLARDPVPTVRHQIAANLAALYATDRDLMWALARHFAANDPSATVLLFMFNHAVARLSPYHATEALDLALTVLDRSDCFASAGSLQEELWQIISGIAVGLGEERAQKRLDSLLARGVKDGRMLTGTLQATQAGLTHESDAVRQRAVEWYRRVAETALREHEALNAQDCGASPPPPEARDHLIELLKVLDTVALHIYVAADVREGRDEDVEPLTDEQRKRLLREASGLIQRLATVSHPGVVHHLVELLHGVLPLDPKRSVRLLETICGGTGELKLVHFESLIVTRIVDVVQMLLADFRDQLASDLEMQASVIEILDGFVAVGWPEAQKLIFGLEDVVR